MKYICNNCKKEYYKPEWRKSKFCSPECCYSYRTGKKRPQCVHDKMYEGRLKSGMYKEMKLKRKLSGNPAWKGKNVGRLGLHFWAKRNWGKPKECEFCHSTQKNQYDWARKYHKYSRNRKDWLRLCRSCHQKYDYKRGFRKSNKGKKYVKKQKN